MTPEERAKGIIGEAHIYAGPEYAHNWQSCATCGTEHEVAKRIRDAEEAIRERCVKIVDLGCLGPPCCELGKSHARHCPQTLVAEIRKRGDS